MKKIITAIAAGSLAVAANAENKVVNPNLWFSGTEEQIDTGGDFVNVYGATEAESKKGSTMGFWFDYDDANDHGGSYIGFPFEEDTYHSLFNPMTQQLGYISVQYNLKDPTLTGQSGDLYNFVGLGFNLVNADKDWMDISSIGGLCVTYTSDDPVLVEIASPEVPDAKACGSALLAQSSPATPATVLWSSFEQPSWVAQAEKIDCSIAIAKASQVKFKVDGGAADMTGKLRIFEVGPQGTCSGNKSVSSNEPTSFAYGDSPNLPGGGTTPGAIKAAKAPASVKAVLSGRTLSFNGITSGATYEIVSLQGQVVKSGVVASSVSLSSLNAGIYMVRVSGKSVNMNQKIILK